MRSIPLICITIILTLGFLSAGLAPADAKVYLDITSPGIRPLVIAVQPFTGGKETSDIVKDDLTFSGIFQCLDDAVQIERPDQPFNPASWRGLGVEMVVKGQARQTGGKWQINVTAYDMADGRMVLTKEFSAPLDQVRPLAHTISNELYKLVTGQQGMFLSKIAYVVEKSGKKEMHLMDWDGHRDRSLGATADMMLIPRWSPDGSKLLYSASRGRQWGIYQLEMSSLRERQVLSTPGLSVAGNFFPDNRQFVFAASRSNNSDIMIGDVTSGSSRKLLSSPWIDVSPAVSPHGYFLVFVSNRAGSPQIYFSDREGFGLRRVTFEGSYNTSPSWSPKGDRIVYTGMSGGKIQIFTMKYDGADIKQLTFQGNNEDPCYSPDGRFVAFTSSMEGGKGVYIMRANGEGIKRITPKNIRASGAGWSPQ